LASFYRAKGDIEQTIKYKERADETENKNWLRISSGSEKRTHLPYLTAFELDQTLSLHLQLAIADKIASHLALTGILRRKGRAFGCNEPML